MRKHFFAITAAIFCLGLLVPSRGSAQERWQLLNEDAGGNRLYLDEGAIEPLPEDRTIRVTFRFDLRKSETKMLFVDELDCRQTLVKRLSLKMLNPVCTGDSETYAISFDGRWDAVSEGIERQLFEAICR